MSLIACHQIRPGMLFDKNDITWEIVSTPKTGDKATGKGWAPEAVIVDNKFNNKHFIRPYLSNDEPVLACFDLVIDNTEYRFRNLQ